VQSVVFSFMRKLYYLLKFATKLPAAATAATAAAT